MPGVEYIAATMRIGDLALHEAEIDLALLEQGNVLGAALRVARIDGERGIDLADRRDDRVRVDGKSAAGRRGAERQLHRIRSLGPGRDRERDHGEADEVTAVHRG
jgi:hypothetical protein